MFALWGLSWWLFAGLQQIDQHLPQAALGAALIYFAVTAMLLATTGHRARWRLLQTLALHLPAVGGVLGALYATDVLHPLAEWAESGWLLLFATHYGLLFLTDAKWLDADCAGERWLHAGAYWLLALLIGWETSWQVDHFTAGGGRLRHGVWRQPHCWY